MEKQNCHLCGHHLHGQTAVQGGGVFPDFLLNTKEKESHQNSQPESVNSVTECQEMRWIVQMKLFTISHQL
jgi:hypothetical protein